MERVLSASGRHERGTIAESVWTDNGRVSIWRQSNVPSRTVLKMDLINFGCAYEIGPESARLSILQHAGQKRHRLYQNFTKTLPDFTKFRRFSTDDSEEHQ
jgi:hypothetical protein